MLTPNNIVMKHFTTTPSGLGLGALILALMQMECMTDEPLIAIRKKRSPTCLWPEDTRVVPVLWLLRLTCFVCTWAREKMWNVLFCVFPHRQSLRDSAMNRNTCRARHSGPQARALSVSESARSEQWLHKDTEDSLGLFDLMVHKPLGSHTPPSS